MSGKDPVSPPPAQAGSPLPSCPRAQSARPTRREVPPVRWPLLREGKHHLPGSGRESPGSAGAPPLASSDPAPQQRLTRAPAQSPVHLRPLPPLGARRVPPPPSTQARAAARCPPARPRTPAPPCIRSSRRETKANTAPRCRPGGEEAPAHRSHTPSRSRALRGGGLRLQGAQEAGSWEAGGRGLSPECATLWNVRPAGLPRAGNSGGASWGKHWIWHRRVPGAQRTLT